MNRQELLKEIGYNRWNEWCEFILGKEVGINSEGETVYYIDDIEKFKRRGRKNK